MYAIDIDQTLSSGVVGKSLQESLNLYRTLGLDTPAGITSYSELFQLPQVLPFHTALPGAVEGVNQLAQSGDVWYYTVREESSHATTHQWLTEKHFPNPQNVVFCRSVLNKLIRIYELYKDTDQPLVLIDDRWQKAIESLDILDNRGARHISAMLRQRFILGCFGAATVPPAPVRLVALPSWAYVADILSSVLAGYP